jgi:hypothetical protein
VDYCSRSVMLMILMMVIMSKLPVTLPTILVTMSKLLVTLLTILPFIYNPESRSVNLNIILRTGLKT